MKISPSKTIDELVDEHDPSDLCQLFYRFKGLDDKGRYLHWTEFKKKPMPEGISSELAWAVVKLKRFGIHQKIKLGDYHFNFFIPNPLQRQLHQIDKAANIHADIGLNKLSSKFLIGSLLMEEAISSAQLDGAVITWQAAMDMLIEGREPQNQSERMVLGNYMLMKQVIATKNEVLTSELIMRFHAIASSETQHWINFGTLREKDELDIDSPSSTFNPPKVSNLRRLLVDFCDFVNKDHENDTTDFFIHPVVKAAMIHLFIGFIHPFDHGNGRVARALFYWFMLKSGYWIFEYVSISKLLISEPANYKRSYLYTENDELDMNYFVDFHIEIILRAITNLYQYLDHKQNEQDSFLVKIKASEPVADLSFRQIDLLKCLVEKPSMIVTSKTVSVIYDIAEASARMDLKQLVAKRYLSVVGRGKPVQYCASENLAEKLFEPKVYNLD